MLLSILAVGTRGDLEPLIALGVGLARAGHQVRLGTHQKFEPFVRRMGLEFVEVAEGVLSAESTRARQRWAIAGRWLPSAVGFVLDAQAVASRRLADAVSGCEGCDAIIASDLATQPLVRSIRRGAGLPPSLSGEPITAMEVSRTLTLYSWSPAVLPPPVPGASPWSHVVGYCFLDQSMDPDPPAGLVEFLNAGPAPVCIAYGSMPREEAVTSLRRRRPPRRDGDDRLHDPRGPSFGAGSEHALPA